MIEPLHELSSGYELHGCGAMIDGFDFKSGASSSWLASGPDRKYPGPDILRNVKHVSLKKALSDHIVMVIQGIKACLDRKSSGTFIPAILKLHLLYF